MSEPIDDFNGDTPHLIRCIKALLDLDASGALVPHGIGGHARNMLSAAAIRLSPEINVGSLKNALELTGCKDEEDLIDMANVGNSLIGRIAALQRCEGPFMNWSPAEDPAEIVGDLYDAIEDKVAHWSKATIDVMAERRRQIKEKGYTAEHDDQYRDGELERAGAAYALYACRPGFWFINDIWAFAKRWWKPRSHRENLIRAVAFLIAAIEKIDRKEAANG